MPSFALEREIDAPGGAADLCARLRAGTQASFLLDGRDGIDGIWGPFVGIDPEVVAEHRSADPDAGASALREVERLVSARRARGGPPGCGLALLLGYELLAGRRRTRGAEGLPDMVVLSVDASVTFPDGAPALLSVRSERGEAGTAFERARGRVEAAAATPVRRPAPASPSMGPLRTSLPREDYLRAVEAVRAHIRRGNIYQANLTQRFASEGAADPFDLYRGMTVGAPAPRAAFVETGSLALASASPEIFLRSGSDGRIETWPIKGTRPRGGSAEEDAAHARALLASEKDRAELLMIVDLERNDLGRVSRTGSVRVRELAALRSYATVHHLVACVEGTLREDVSVSDIMRATFPGGSITGAPKERAIEILRELEPVSRNFYTGSLVWLGDDGRIDSSILIRSMTIAGGRALVGAGGGVVWDSDPEEEWLESCNKARAVLRVLGYEPEEAR